MAAAVPIDSTTVTSASMAATVRGAVAAPPIITAAAEVADSRAPEPIRAMPSEAHRSPAASPVDLVTTAVARVASAEVAPAKAAPAAEAAATMEAAAAAAAPADSATKAVPMGVPLSTPSVQARRITIIFNRGMDMSRLPKPHRRRHRSRRLPHCSASASPASLWHVVA